MFLYFPNATRVNANGEDEGISIYGGYGSVEKAIEQFSIWEDYYNFKLKSRWIDVYEGINRIDRIPIKSLVEIVAEWKAEIGIKSYQETVAIHRSGDTLNIVTQKPGLFIGLYGDMCKKYKDLIQSNGYKISHINFVDIFCGNVREF